MGPRHDEHWDAFLSYARKDGEPFVRRFREALCRSRPGLSVRYDRVHMPSRGLDFSEEIARAIGRSGRVLLLLGDWAAESAYVRAEWQYALAIGKAVVPLLRPPGRC